MSWVPTTERERDSMLATIGVDSIADLFRSIPPELRAKSWDLPEGISEMAVRRMMKGMAAKNQPEAVSFLGAGAYDHYVPAAVDALTSRQEFYTAYTPYQPEAAQGTLQCIYEYQSVICRLTEMEFANASLYDGGTAVFEAATMAMRITRRTKVVLDRSVNPRYRSLLRTHTANLDIELVEGQDPTDAACVIVQNPGFRGTVHDFTELAEKCHEAGALLVMSVYPTALGLIKTPGAMGADIVIGEGQCLGTPLQFGGPYLGIMATRKEHVRKMPGRIGAMTKDLNGDPGFVLTLQAREQHIRRGKAMSNICSNEALIALRSLIYLCLMGKDGFQEVARHCHAKAEYLKSRMSAVEIVNDGPTFNEFTVRLPKGAEDFCRAMLDKGFVAGLPIVCLDPAADPHDLIIAVTEQRTREELDAFANAIQELLKQ